MRAVNILNHIVGKESAKLALILLSINPRCGGCLLIGGVGTGKSLLARALIDLLPSEMPWTRVPLNVTEEAMEGGYDLEMSLKMGEPVLTEGILKRTAGGILLVDDLNLLSPSVVSSLIRALDEGIISLVATVNPSEGPVHPAIQERVGLQVCLRNLEGMETKIRIMSLEVGNGSTENGKVRDFILQARRRLKRVKISDDVIKEITRRVLESGMISHRRDLFLLEASRAYAALAGEEEVLLDHVERVVPLVLTPVSATREEEAFLPSGDVQKEERPSSAPLDGNRKEKGKEEVFEVGEPYEITPLTFPMDRINRMPCGRRTPTKVNRRGGRAVGITSRGGKDIAVGPTIRAAAPYQTLRGRTSSMIIKEEDLRFWRRVRKMGHLVIFVADASGSMGVNRRMVETKGAILSMLLDCYRYRDQIAMISFRGEGASVLLPPTSSVTMAVRRLKEMPVGGKTPLSQGLLTASNMIITEARRSPELRFIVVLITDGKANYSPSGEPVMVEIKHLARRMRKLPRTDFLVIDTEDKNSLLRADRARLIADILGARYYAMPDLKSRNISWIVRNMAL